MTTREEKARRHALHIEREILQPVPPGPETVLIAQAGGTAIIIAHEPRGGFVSYEIDNMSHNVEDALPDLPGLDKFGDGLYIWRGNGHYRRYDTVDGYDFDVWLTTAEATRPATLRDIRRFFPDTKIVP